MGIRVWEIEGYPKPKSCLNPLYLTLQVFGCQLAIAYWEGMKYNPYIIPLMYSLIPYHP